MKKNENDVEDFIRPYLISMFVMIVLWVIMISTSTFFIDYSKHVIALKGFLTAIFLVLSFLIVAIFEVVKYQIEIRFKGNTMGKK